ncbi:substrate-binding periplasmic protein [Piscirickettsia salmonis]|uniref:substrate-binding periplasmic protein n=1 Tax=Piscirickettsia salmonis TaxID=1238 RepID=UPI0012BAC1F9|nr:transporter substrate-binding domain-containing protein [Piscirickettsia salmonis]QGP55184.1 cystine transporter subunit [Piscirickettsia salmonis]QGP58960.1 cystine transporter subunit [Piscirickettsia salmonis]QGP64748.1 cystine transporter subunit [Piscirickettsia salmonis]
MKRFQQLIAIVSMIIFSFSSYGLEKLRIMTEDYPPFNYLDKDKQLKGYAVELLTEVIKKIDAPQDIAAIKVAPWARGYSQAQKPGLKNMLFATTRTEEREILFKWVGPIAQTKIVVFASTDNPITINSAEDLKKYKFAAIRGDIGAILLGSNKVPTANIHQLNKFSLLTRMVEKKRVDMFAYEQSGAIDLMKKNNIDTSKFKVAYVLKKGELYYAFNLSVDEKTINAYQQGLEDVKKDSVFIKTITDKYLK